MAGCVDSLGRPAEAQPMYEEALGMSYAGRRALVSMKHVGLNVAADAFMNSSYSPRISGASSSTDWKTNMR